MSKKITNDMITCLALKSCGNCSYNNQARYPRCMSLLIKDALKTIQHQENIIKKYNEITVQQANFIIGTRAEWRHISGDEWHCSKCDSTIYTEGSWEKPEEKYCPHCGAKMNEEREDKE